MEACVQTETELSLAAWKRTAKTQGLVCLVCGEAPELEDRDTFFDTGVCCGCAAEMKAKEETSSR